EFAWGPTKDKTLRDVAAIEVVVATGKGGGKGWIDLDQLAVRTLPEVTAPPPPVRAEATSAAPGAAPALAVDGVLTTAWRSDPRGADAAHGPAFTLDLGRERERG